MDLYKNPYVAQQEFIYENNDKYPRDELYAFSFKIYQKTIEELYTNDTIKSIVRWIKSKKWRNYSELGQYIFVHAFIPLKGRSNAYLEESGEYYSSWREETNSKMWEDSTWGCPYKLYLNHCFDEELKKNKILVCGHWHTSDFYNKLFYKDDKSKQLNVKEDNPIFKSDLFLGLIGLDACTALTKKVNILVIESKN